MYYFFSTFLSYFSIYRTNHLQELVFQSTFLSVKSEQIAVAKPFFSSFLHFVTRLQLLAGCCAVHRIVCNCTSSQGKSYLTLLVFGYLVYVCFVRTLDLDFQMEFCCKLSFDNFTIVLKPSLQLSTVCCFLYFYTLRFLLLLIQSECIKSTIKYRLLSIWQRGHLRMSISRINNMYFLLMAAGTLHRFQQIFDPLLSFIKVVHRRQIQKSIIWCNPKIKHYFEIIQYQRCKG